MLLLLEIVVEPSASKMAGRALLLLCSALAVACAAASAAAAAATPPTLEAELLKEARGVHADYIAATRRALHQIPELAFEEVETSALVRRELDALGVQYTWPIARTGIVARLGPPPYRVALRADMDGLPIEEAVNATFKSRHPGRMHACGHDGHTAMLLGAARLLKKREPEMVARGHGGGVLLVFQPAEEGGGGAFEVVRAGAVDGVRAIFGLHLWPAPAAEAGAIATRPGALMAASTRFSAAVRGRGGHAALPHATVDPVPAAAAAVLALQTLVSRETAPVDAAVVSVTRLHTLPLDGAANVIGDAVELGGTVRAVDPATFERLRRRVEEVVNATAAAAGARAEAWRWSPRPYPAVVNDAALAGLAASVARALADAAAAARNATSRSDGGGPHGSNGDSSGDGDGGHVRWRPLDAPTLAAEDFAAYRAAGGVPSLFAFLAMAAGGGGGGGGDAAAAADAGLHTPRFAIDERQLPVGAALHAALALRALERFAAEGGGGGLSGGGGGSGGAAAAHRGGGGGEGHQEL